MNNSKIWLSSPHMGGEELNFINQAFTTNWIAPLGPNVDGFELDLENRLGNGAYVAVLSSGTAAIHLGLILLGVQAGDEVICQTMTFCASTNPILYLGAIPVFVDSESDTWNLCPLILEQTIVDRISKGKKPKVIIAVHLYGVPCKINEIRLIADKYGILILEDSAEALGSFYNSQPCGTFGDIGVFSFNGNKIITTSGGGAIIVKSKSIKEKAIFYASQAREQAPHYQHTVVGYNYRMSNVSAGIGRGQMLVLDSRVDLRRKMHEFYLNLFQDIPAVTVFEVPNKKYYANFWLSTILIEPSNEISAEGLRLALEVENIESRPLWKPMHLQPVFEMYPYYGNSVAQSLFEKGLCLPSGSNLTIDDKERIATVVKTYFKV